MTRAILLAAVASFALAAPAMAQSTCTAPTAPTVPDGKTATADDINKSLTAVKAFIADSDKYQSCLVLDLQNQKDAAAKANAAFDPAVEAAITKKGDDNQAEKEKVAKAYQDAAHTYNLAHK